MAWPAVSTTTPIGKRALVRAFAMRQADGMVILPAGGNHAYLTREVHPATPVIFVDRPPNDSPHPVRGELTSSIAEPSRPVDI